MADNTMKMVYIGKGNVLIEKYFLNTRVIELTLRER